LSARSQVRKIIASAYTEDIADELLKSYAEIENNYVLGRWKASELDAGHFVESVRRLLELQLTGAYTPFTTKLGNFSDAVLKQYENATGHDESFRMLIPRTLKSIYNIRNKRGVGHVAGVSPNEMDATFILYSVKWVLAELVRLNSTLSLQETQILISQIVEREMSLLWKEENFTRVLSTRLRARDKVLVLLLDSSPRSDSELQATIEYTSATKFKKVLRELHRERLIEYRESGECFISPLGSAAAEAIIYLQHPLPLT
jgi:hypothetical protein